MTTPTIVALIMVVGLALSVLLIAVGRAEFFTSRVPDWSYRGIRVRYLDGAVVPWRGMEDAIDTLIAQTELEFPGASSRELLGGLWIEVVPYSGLCKSVQLCPTGIAKIAENGRVLYVRATGTMRIESPPLFGERHPVLVIRQLRKDDTLEQERAASGPEGPIREAGSSAIYHEFCQHWVPFVMRRGDWNAGHTDAGLKLMTKRYGDAQIARRNRALGSETVDLGGRPG